jgi:type III secretion protein K
VHQSLLWARGGVGAQMRRQFRRVDQSKDAMEFLGKRIPPLDAFNMEMKPFEQRPLHAGHVVLTRGYRLLLALIALEGQATLLRIQRKLPHRISTLAVPTLNQQQARQLSELVLSCIVTERFSQWDWLF